MVMTSTTVNASIQSSSAQPDSSIAIDIRDDALVGAIVGGVIGGLILISIVVVVVVLVILRRRKSQLPDEPVDASELRDRQAGRPNSNYAKIVLADNNYEEMPMFADRTVYDSPSVLSNDEEMDSPRSN